MDVVVTVCTLPAEAQVSSRTFPERLVADEFFLVAPGTIDPSMGPLEVIACQGVIETGLVETDHLEVPAVVIVVAGSTFLSFHLCRYVIAPGSLDPGVDLFMTVEALPVGDLLSQYMAFDAVGHPFQVGMGLGQIPGTELCHKRPGWKGQEDRDQP